jgi:hypothetical protein
MVVSGYIHAPGGFLEDKGPQYPVYGGLERAHHNSRHDVLTVSFIWLDVSYTFPFPQLVMLFPGGGGGGVAERAFCTQFNQTSGDKRLYWDCDCLSGCAYLPYRLAAALCSTG